MGFTQKGRNDGHNQNQNQPRTKRYQSGSEQQQRNNVLHLRKYLSKQYRAAGSLAAGAFEFVVEDRVFELVQIQLRCVVDQIDGGFIGHQIAQQAITQPD